jgi:membrane peptidoglycan carboxypeptidase
MKDRWFCGYTQYYTAAVWCGYDIPEVISLTGSDRSNPAGRLWKKVMEPLHRGKSSEKLYNEDNFVQINVCTGCGKLATASCSLDPRTKDTGESVVETVMVYPEDMPLDDCTCHVKVKWCNECNAVANEYCKKLATLGMCTLSERALVKMTQAEVDDLAAASKHGLYARHFQDNYVYLVDDHGRAASFHGFMGDKNVDVSAPYLICDVHTKEMWQDAQKPDQDEDPDEPTDPEDPTIPEFEFPMFPNDPLFP